MSKLYNGCEVGRVRFCIIRYPGILLLLISLFLTANVFAQQKTIVGMVVDEKSEALPGVSAVAFFIVIVPIQYLY